MRKSFSALALSASLAVIVGVSGAVAVPAVAVAQDRVAELVSTLDSAIRAAAAQADAAGLSGEARTDFVLAAIQNAIVASGADPMTAQMAISRVRSDMIDSGADESLGVYWALNRALASLSGESGPAAGGGAGGGPTGGAPLGSGGSAGGGGGGGSDYRPNT